MLSLRISAERVADPGGGSRCGSACCPGGHAGAWLGRKPSPLRPPALTRESSTAPGKRMLNIWSMVLYSRVCLRNTFDVIDHMPRSCFSCNLQQEEEGEEDGKEEGSDSAGGGGGDGGGNSGRNTIPDRRRVLAAMNHFWEIYTVVSQRDLQLMGTGALLRKVRHGHYWWNLGLEVSSIFGREPF